MVDSLRLATLAITRLFEVRTKSVKNCPKNSFSAITSPLILSYFVFQSIKMIFYETRLEVMDWFYSHFQQSYIKRRVSKTLKTQERRVKRGGRGGKGGMGGRVKD